MTINGNVELVGAEDQRGNVRFAARRAGKLFLVEGGVLDCVVMDLSAGGAAVYCPEPVAPDVSVVLYVEGFGRFDALTTRYAKGALGLKFACDAAERAKLEHDLAAFVREGMTNVTRLRRHHRAGGDAGIDFFTCADGSPVACQVLDISFQGALLKTAMRPAVGDVIQLGRTRGWVVRHHEQGIGVQFLQHFEEA